MPRIKQTVSKCFAALLGWLKSKKNGEDITYKYRASMSFDTLGELLKKNSEVTVSRDGFTFIVKAGKHESRSVYLHDALQDALRKSRRR